MPGEMRPSGLEVLGDVPWGSHFCQFYQTTQDFLEVLVPYFDAGLAGDELCVWFSCCKDPRQFPECRAYLDSQSEIRLVLTPVGDFQPAGILGDLKQLIAQAAAAGKAGLRCLGDLGSMPPEEVRQLREHESCIFAELAEEPLLTICAYPLHKSDAADLLEVASLHHAAIVKRKNAWGVVSWTESKEAPTLIHKTIKEREELRLLSARLTSVREEEGLRIARELHDELGSTLTGMKWELEAFERDLAAENRDTEREKILRMTTMLDSMLDSIRRISAELRPPMLELGLVAALDLQVREFAARTGIDAKFDNLMEEDEPSRDASLALFRIVQEALTNVSRHAGATRVNVCLSCEDGHLVLEIKDNGVGIEVGTAPSLGLVGMRERAQLVGGTLEIKNAQGTTITVRLPHPC